MAGFYGKVRLVIAMLSPSRWHTFPCLTLSPRAL